MKLLLDQNLSFRLINQLSKTFPGSKHVKDFGLTEADDEQIWGYAAKNSTLLFRKIQILCIAVYSEAIRQSLSSFVQEIVLTPTLQH